MKLTEMRGAPPPADVVAWMTKFGDMTTAEIRRLLADSGVQGYCDEPTKCPLATFVRRETGSAVTIGVNFTVPTTNEQADEYAYWAVRHPASVHEFVRAFDAGDFPELEA